jgi:hypothetical protein
VRARSSQPRLGAAFSKHARTSGRQPRRWSQTGEARARDAQRDDPHVERHRSSAGAPLAVGVERPMVSVCAGAPSSEWGARRHLRPSGSCCFGAVQAATCERTTKRSEKRRGTRVA